MELIDKSALVAEIDKILDYAEEHWDTDYVKGAWWFVDKLQQAIDTLEVKEVDFEKEIQAFSKMELEPIKICDANVGLTITMHQLYQCAKHFFDLGIRVAQKGE